LIQQGKGADVGAAFGSGSSGTVFGGAGGASFLTRATAWLAIAFFVIAFGLAYLAKQRSEAVDTLGIPTVPTQSSQGQLTQPQESVDLPAIDGDVPTLEVEEDPDGDIPQL
jgi:preprotein translocase subunit SecG